MASRVYLFRLQILIIDGGVLVLRNIVDQNLIANGITLDKCLNNEKANIRRLRSRGVLTQAQYYTLFPPTGQIPTTLDLDITFIICLLRNLRCFGLNRSFDWNNKPLPTDISTEADIWRLKDYRNRISNILSTKEITETDFITWWNDIKQILIRLDPSSTLNIMKRISDFETCALDEKEEERRNKEIEKWDQYEIKDDKLQEKIGVVEKNVSDMKTDVSEVKTDVSKVKADISGMETKVSEMNTDIRGMKTDVSDLRRRQDEADKITLAATPIKTEEEKYQERKNQKRSCTDDCIYDGRLIKLSANETKRLGNENSELVGQGTFGKVYKSQTESKRFGMQVVTKKIPFNDKNQKSIKREMIMSRVLHPFILPLLAVVKEPMGRQESWLVSPYCRKGDLNTAIKEGKEINARNRVKVLLQVALAIKYIHTPVTGIREVILHKDISSKNIVLDDKYNARLIDFGSAREKNDFTATAAGKQCYSHPQIGEGVGANESWDYFSFGVIIREMLTSLGPEGKENRWLLKMSLDEVRQNIDSKIWTADMQDQVKMMNEIAADLLDKEKKWNVSIFTENVIDELKQACAWFGCRRFLDIADNNDSCHSCMINKKAKKSSLIQKHKANCCGKIEVCIACEKNSFLNPIYCYCGEQLTPDIGSKWGALLVAGKDSEDVGISKALTKDVKELEKLLMSLAPRVFGISQDNIKTVVPDDQDNLQHNEQLWNKFKNRLEIFSQREDIDTLLIYISCHGDKESKSFKFCNEDSGSTEEFQTLIDNLKKIDTLIIILDRCYPPMVHFQDSKRKYLQINCCKEEEEADMNDDGSIFTKYLIRGLKAKSESKVCPEGCQPCLNYWKNGSEFIKFDNLVEYIRDHIKDKQTVTSSHTLYDKDSNIAFYTGDPVFIHFYSDIGGNHVNKNIALDQMKDFEELTMKLKEEFEQREKSVKICIHTVGRQKETYGYCDNIQKVMRAWVLRQELEVIFY